MKLKRIHILWALTAVLYCIVAFRFWPERDMVAGDTVRLKEDVVCAPHHEWLQYGAPIGMLPPAELVGDDNVCFALSDFE